MRRLIGTIFAWIGGLVFLFLLIVVLTAVISRSARSRIASNTVLELDLETGMIEDMPDDPLARLTMAETPVIRDVVEAIGKAAKDQRIAGIVARIGAGQISLAQAQEVRDAIRDFRANKKWAVAWGETFGEFGPGNGAYYLATAFDEIWLQPSGDVGLTGFIMESPFVKGALDKLGIVPRMDHRWEYKNAMNMFTEKKYTPAHREAMEKVLTSWYGQLVRAISETRNIKPDEVKALIDRGPFLGKQALDARLVDAIGYRDEVYQKVKEKAGKDSHLLYLKKYLDKAGRPHTSGKTIALIFGVGGVQRGKSSFDATAGEGSMGSDTVTAAFRSAIHDNNVKAILFRIDSPGGSYVASDAIWKEVTHARKAGKPVITSMSSVAGSGGYFVAMAADKIVAQPGTITGSIGVLGGKMLTNGLWDKLGISWDEVHAGENATMFTGTKDYTPAEWAKFQAWLDRVYVDFTSKVADGRKMPKDKVLQIAKGRIWSGEDAKNLGLVDELGGYPVALKLAKQAAKIPDTEGVELKVYPPKRSTAEVLLALLSGEQDENSEPKTAAVLVQALKQMQPVVRALKAAGVMGQPGVLSMPAMEVGR